MTTPLVRAAHLIVYIDVLRDIGAPVDLHLAHAGLPMLTEEAHDGYLCVPRVLDFVSRSSRDASVIEIGFLAAQRSSLSTLSREFQRAILAAPNGLQRIRSLLRFDRLEDGALRSAVVREGGFLRIICNLEHFRESDALAYSEWLQIQGLISIVRSVAGPRWCPTEMTFISRNECSRTARDTYGNARMLHGQRNTSILVPVEVLAGPCVDDHAEEDIPAPADVPDDLVTYLKKAIRPYLAGPSPNLGLAADMASMSSRTLQRELAHLGRTYSDILAEVRYEAASVLLSDTSTKIVEIAYESGYQNPEHFSRAFRRSAGISPREYRKSLANR